MKKDIRTWWSPSLGKDMRLITYGTGGTPVLAFPGDGGTAEDWENHGVLAALEHQISEGYNIIYCVDSVDHESLLNTNVDPFVRLMRQKQYENYLVDEVFPFIKDVSTQDFMIGAGIHLGGYQVMNLALRFSHKINKAITVLGTFDIRTYLEGYSDDNSYFLNPAEYLPNLNDPKILNAIRDVDIKMVTSPNSKNGEINSKISTALHNKNVPHVLDNEAACTDESWNAWGDVILRHIP